MSADSLWESTRVLELVAEHHCGGLIRVGRQAHGWRQADLGARIGCVAATVSRLERRARPSDLGLVVAAARAVGVPARVLAASLQLGAPSATTVTAEGSGSTTEDLMRRRTLLAAAGLAAPASLLSLDQALAAPPDPTGSPVPLDTRLAAGRRHFDAGHYTRLLTDLHGLLGDAHHAARSRHATDLARLSVTYSLASQVLIKTGQYPQARLAADRAATYAEWSSSPLATAAAARELAIVLRHQDQPAAAQRHALTALTTVERTGLRTDAQTSAYAQMLATTAYTAARTGDRHQALTMIREARRAARNLPAQPPAGRLFPLTPAAVDLYAVGVHWALKDAGAALDVGRGLHPGQFQTAERKGRLLTERGRVYLLADRPEQAAVDQLWDDRPDALVCAN
ncbi:multiprotein-bridging factor 1 family protein, partial [Streptomyces sp. NPDC059003]|uniref:helix-turn-helix domain-containing protein n=1 Tax=Streptomyces sp. NPDC059003 TaxID=3346691 RepID=UPI0036AC4958